MEVAKAKKRLRLYTTLDCQLFMIWRHLRTNYNCLWYQVNVWRTFPSETMKQLKLTQLDKVLYKWCTTMCSEGKLVTRSIIIEKANSFYNEMKITSWLAHALWGQ